MWWWSFSVWAAALLFLPSQICAQSTDLPTSSETVKAHLEKVLSEYNSFEQNYGRQVVEEIVKDAKAESYACNRGQCLGAKKHPWQESGNPQSTQDWQTDSYLVRDYQSSNSPNYTNNHGCYEFGLLGHSYKSDGSDLEVTAEEGVACQAYCRASAAALPWCWEHAAPQDVPWFPFPKNDNGSETAVYWFPEYQVATNNYGVNRIRPEEIGQPLFTRQALLASKEMTDEAKSEAAGENYPYSAEAYNPPAELKQPPFAGQGWAGFYTPDFQEKRYAHIYRTEFSVSQSDQKVHTQLGWNTDTGREKSLLDSFPPKSSEHAKANIWTEYGMWDLVTGIPEFSRRMYSSQKVGENIMNALFGNSRPISEAAKEDPPFWQTEGAMAYRTSKWHDVFGDLGQLYDLSATSSPYLAESVYKGGYELYPLVSNASGFGTPELSFGALVVRRALYAAGENEAMMPYYPTNVPSPRIMQYTIDAEGDHSREIDKLQRLRPLKDNLRTSECFRSQNIPNFVNKDKSLQEWADQNLPRSLLKYTTEPEAGTIQGNDVSFVYWNRRISCHCRYCGINTGSYTMNDGDKLYDQRKPPLCSYPLGSAFSAWEGKDTYPKCQKGLNSQFERYRGLNDRV